MARTKEFDYEQALDRAMHVFWNKGYEATSIQDIVDATGVNRASLYNTFGDKKALFLKALDRFASDNQHSLAATTAHAAPGLGRIRETFRQAAAATLQEPRGCFLMNSTTELATQDPEMCELGHRARQTVESFFVSCLKDAAARGEWHSPRRTVAVARFLTNTVFGLRTMAKMQPDRDLVDDIVETALSVIR